MIKVNDLDFKSMIYAGRKHFILNITKREEAEIYLSNLECYETDKENFFEVTDIDGKLLATFELRKGEENRGIGYALYRTYIRPEYYVAPTILEIIPEESDEYSDDDFDEVEE